MWRRVVVCWWRYCGGYFGRVVRLRVCLLWARGRYWCFGLVSELILCYGKHNVGK